MTATLHRHWSLMIMSQYDRNEILISDITTSDVSGRHQGPKRKLRADCRVPSLKHVMLRLFFIVECGIACSLCAMCVFEVEASSSSPRLPLCQILFLLQSTAELAHKEKSSTQSLTHPAYLMPH